MVLLEKIAGRLKRARLNRLTLGQAEAKLADRQGAIILCYHALDPVLSDYPYRTLPSAFEAQLRFLAGFCDILPLADVIAGLNERALSGRRVAAITFDDGYRCNHSLATPVLDRLNIPATLFAPRDLIQRPGQTYLSENALCDLAGHPLWSVGAHGITHNVLTGFHPDDRERELAEGRDWLTQLLGHVPQGFAYPQGRLSPDILVGARLFYDYALSTDSRALPGYDPHQIRRYCPMQPDDDLTAFARALLNAQWETGDKG